MGKATGREPRQGKDRDGTENKRTTRFQLCLETSFLRMRNKVHDVGGSKPRIKTLVGTMVPTSEDIMRTECVH